jgi:hypothetical protein
VLLVAISAGIAAAADDIHVTPLARDGRVLVSFSRSAGFDRDVVDAIQSGLPITFSYDVELRRSMTLWFDRGLASATVAATVQYDNLTRRNQLTRSVDGHTEDSRITEDPSTVRGWLTTFDRLPLFTTRDLEPNAEYYVRVRAHTQPRVAWFFWPWDRSAASGHATFTFLP